MPVAAQKPDAPAKASTRGKPRPKDEEPPPFPYRLEPPEPATLFQLISEDALRERLRREALTKKRGGEFEYPDPEGAAPAGPYLPPRRPRQTLWAEPNYLCYRRLLFEQPNAERYGLDLGVLHPGVSAGLFYLDLFLLPVHLALPPWRCYDSNAGYCLPGDPVRVRGPWWK